MLDEKILITDIINVGTNKVDISTLEKPIIGTDALATCVGMLIYSEDKKRAIVAHVSDGINAEASIYNIVSLIGENNLDDGILKYKIFEGYYHNHYGVKNDLEDFCKGLPALFVPFDEDEIPSDAIHVDEELGCHDFAFDSSTGKFVTDKVNFDNYNFTNISKSSRR